MFSSLSEGRLYFLSDTVDLLIVGRLPLARLREVLGSLFFMMAFWGWVPMPRL